MMIPWLHPNWARWDIYKDPGTVNVKLWWYESYTFSWSTHPWWNSWSDGSWTRLVGGLFPWLQMQADAVLNVAQAFIVAGVPCMVMPHWLSNNAWVTLLLFDWLYQHMKEGKDVATVLHHAMLEMLDNWFGIKYWGAYSVFGLPTVHLPQEMLVEIAHPDQPLINYLADSTEGIKRWGV